MKYSPFKFFTKNTVGRDFVVGDIHGMFAAFESLLKKVKFDKQKDRMFSVGDLVDRGPESQRALEFVNQPWFFSILGNHESMLLDSETDSEMLDNWVTHCGGDWWNALSQEEQQKMREQLGDLPIVMEVETSWGRVGIVHADVPLHMHWSYFLKDLQEGVEMRNYSMWSRNRYKQMQFGGLTPKVDGVDLVVVGHTPVTKPFQLENVYFIDTGAPYTKESSLANLTLLELNKELDIHRISTYQREIAGFRF